MTIELNYVTDIRVYLPSEYEEASNLKDILDYALDVGASEVSLIGPWILFEASTRDEASTKMDLIINRFGL